MQEDFLHYVWKHTAFNLCQCQTTQGEILLIKSLGQHNHNSGPDFFNAQITIGDQLWAGNVEIHIKSSDWYVHNHQQDPAYDNVILHIVWEHDAEIYRKDNSIIPTLELKNFVNINLLNNYKKLIKSKSWINCERDFGVVDSFIFYNWLERLYFERLEIKSKSIEQFLESSHNDWEAVLFKLLLKNFGLKVNGEAMLSIANSLDYTIVRKVLNNPMELEALLFGQAKLLSENIEDPYFKDLKNRYSFLRQKFKLTNQGVLPLKFFRLRPSNFPTIRLSQFVKLYTTQNNLFSKIIDTKSKQDLYKLFEISTTEFWNTHYTLSKESKTLKKSLTKDFIDLLIINTIIPLKFTYAKSQGKHINEDLLLLIKEIKLERNSVIDKFLSLKAIEKNALISQALLQLKNEYCDKNKCLQCAIGNSLIIKN